MGLLALSFSLFCVYLIRWRKYTRNVSSIISHLSSYLSSLHSSDSYSHPLLLSLSQELTDSSSAKKTKEGRVSQIQRSDSRFQFFLLYLLNLGIGWIPPIWINGHNLVAFRLLSNRSRFSMICEMSQIRSIFFIQALD